MCNNNEQQQQHGGSSNNSGSPPPSSSSTTTMSSQPVVGNPMFLPGLEHYRLQLYHYAMAERLRLAQQLQHHPAQHPGVAVHQPSTVNPGGFPAPLPLYPAAIAAATAAGYPGRLALSMALLHHPHQRIPEEPKPQHSYIGLIAMAILESPEKKLVLSDIYQHILSHYPYFRTRGPGWRNSIRHNLSLNDCFVKSGRSANGKGHYWAIHPANCDDFRRGDFRRRKAQRKVRRHMGLAVDEEPDSPSPPPQSPPITQPQPIALWNPHRLVDHHSHHTSSHHHHHSHHSAGPYHQTPLRGHSSVFQPRVKRQFDVASLLAPDVEHQRNLHLESESKKYHHHHHQYADHHCSSKDSLMKEELEIEADEEEVDVVAESANNNNELHHQMPSSPVDSGAATPSPDAAKLSIISAPTANLCNNWSGDQRLSERLSVVHLHNHLYVRNYYMPDNAATNSTV